MNSDQLQKLVDLIARNDDVAQKLREREKEHRINDLVAVAKENQIAVSPAEAEQVIGALDRSQKVSRFIDEFGRGVSAEAFQKIAKNLYP